MCPDEYKLAAWIEGKLSLDEATSLESHLKSCTACFEQAFFLKKTLNRETLFIKYPEEKNPLQKLLLWFDNQNIKIKEMIGKIQAKPLGLSFRNSEIKKETVALEMDGLEMIIEKTEKEIVLGFLNAGFIQVLSPKKRILFAGNVTPESKIYLNSQESSLLKTEHQEVLLEWQHV